MVLENKIYYIYSMPNKKYTINKSVFDREIKLCQKLSKENNGKCNWGKCKDCGVLLLLQKFYQGKLVEDKNEIKKIKKDVLKI